MLCRYYENERYNDLSARVRRQLVLFRRLVIIFEAVVNISGHTVLHVSLMTLHE